MAYSLNHILLPLFVLSKVIIALLRPFIGFHCLTKLLVIFICLLFRIVYSLYHILLPLFMLSKVNITLFWSFIGFHCLTKLIICLNLDLFFIYLCLGLFIT